MSLGENSTRDSDRSGTTAPATVKLAAGHLDDRWVQVDSTADPDFFIRFLDASRARSLDFARNHPDVAFAHLALEPGLSVLDCGCGTGDMLAIIARLVAPGQALGGDSSEAMLREARHRAAAAKPTNLSFQSLDVQRLPFPDASYDRVLATQLLVHVPDPDRAMHEMCRVTTHGGRVAVSDMDWDSLVVGCSDKELGRRFTRLFSDGVRNGVVVRGYAGMLRAEGFENIQTIPQAILFDSWPFFKEWVVGPSLPHFVEHGTMSPEEAQRLVDDLANRNEAGGFFAAVSSYTVTGRRPH